MTEISSASTVTEQVGALARALVSGVQTAALYPPDHPQVATVVAHLHATVQRLDAMQGFTVGVAPDTLMLDGKATDQPDTYVTEAACLLHERDIVRVTFSSQIKARSLQSLLSLLALDIAGLRARGGAAKAWLEDGDGAILIEQIDYHEVLRDHDTTRPESDQDEMWVHLVRSVGRRDASLSEAEQARLLEIAGDAGAIQRLANSAIADHRTPDGSPLVTTQASAVLATYQHLRNIVSVMAPERSEELARNLAASTADLDPRVVVEMMRSGQRDEGDEDVVRGLGEAFDEEQVAQLLATTLALDGKASERLAEVFDTIVPDPERKDRVVALTKSMLNDGDFGSQQRFEALWTSVDSLVVSHDERPFVSSEYRQALDTATTRGESMAATAPLPPELGDWMETVEPENVRDLSVTLLSDLLRLETGAARASELTTDMQAMAEDLLLAGEYAEALRLADSLAERATATGAAGRVACRRALDELGACTALRDSVGLLSELGDVEIDEVRALCRRIGAAAVESLHATLMFEKKTRARVRGSEMIVSFGAAAVGRLAPLVTHEQWFVQRNAAEVLGRIGVPASVPLLQPLLRGVDPRVLREAVVALAAIDDPGAARAIHTVLRSSTGEGRQAVIDALIDASDARVVPLLARILDESQALGRDHTLSLETLDALGKLRDEAAVPAVARVMRQWRWFARRRNRALKTTAVGTLHRIGTAAATAALTEAARTGDRLLRRIVSLHATGN